MKKTILKNRNISLIAILVVLGWFYWFQYRQSQIRSECMQLLRRNIKEKNGEMSRRGVQDSYDICFVERGLKPEKLLNN
ncbi:hypothetical protein A3E10_00995 [Candidatus Roizmanbacteria bacterium RIFCSPHIGHO2_12_FULL_37_23]|nr:MAG: hypothetical protein A3E10_00995 [Candidatus Roizmanbacteria bacterium RIFCSPHIGHO2_12_FULL_37_23]